MAQTTCPASQLLERHQNLVYYTARNSFPQQAQDPDLLQSGFIGLWKAARSWDGRRPFSTYACRCIQNEMRSYLRKLRRWGPTLPPVGQDQPVPSQEERILDDLAFYQAVEETWPPNSRERLVLTALAAGVSKAALAAGLGTDTYHITKLARRAYRALPRSAQGP